MKLKRADIRKLEEFLDKIKDDTYPEPPMEPHISITDQMIDYLTEEVPLSEQKSARHRLWAGSGIRALFEQRPVAGGNKPEPGGSRNVPAKRLRVLEMDQSFLDFPDKEFDLVWCRHCLEHSIFPYFTLYGFHRVLKPGGYLYVEVPAPDTSCQHQTNKNHYSVIGKSMWLDLMNRAGFALSEQLDINFTVPAGGVYWAFILQRP